MKMLTKTKIIYFILSVGVMIASKAEAKDLEFSYPLKRITHMTGGFGEFRNDHFHAGIDISTYGQTGWDVISPVDGFVSRVKVSSFGYGKAIYLTTMDGEYTVVFAHLKRFRNDVERLIRKKQLKNAEYFQDIHLEAKTFRVKKGEVIALSGDTGGVFPHLHYEVRDRSEKPLRFSIPALERKDREPPVLKSLALHPLDAESSVNGRHETFICKLSKNKSGHYVVDGEKISVMGKVGISLYAYDESKGNKVGLNRVRIENGGKDFFSVDIKNFSYDVYDKIFYAYSRKAYLETKKGFLNLFEKERNKLSFLYSGNGKGVFNVNEASQSVRIFAYDVSGNESVADIDLMSMGTKKLDYDKEIILRDDKIIAYSDVPAKLRISLDGKVSEFELREENEDFYKFVFSPKSSTRFRQMTCQLIKSDKILAEKNILAVVIDPGEHNTFKSGMHFLESFKDSIEKRRIIEVKKKEDVQSENPELIPIGIPAFSLEPISMTFWMPVRFGILLDKKMQQEKVALFINNFGKWEFLSNHKDKDYSSGNLSTGGLLAVMKDTVPPSISLLESKKGEKKSKNTIEVEVKDEGSGLDYKALDIQVNGLKVPFEVNTRKDLVKIDLGDKTRQYKNSVRVYIKAADNTGNQSEKDYKISF